MDLPKKRYRRGQWLVERERHQIGLPAPPRPLDDAAEIRPAIEALMKKFGTASVTWLNELEQDWPGLVGETVAKHTRPGHLQETTLTVYVDSAAWLAELSRFGQREMLNKIQAKYDKTRIRSVRLQPDPDQGK